MHVESQPRTEPRRRSAPVEPMVLFLALIVLLAGAVRAWPRTVDDAYITFRYADNVVRGAGPVFNPGEPVEGHSSPSWMLLAAASIAVGLDPVIAAKTLGLLSSLCLVVLLYRVLLRVGVKPMGRTLAVMTLGSSLVLQIWSVAGMETNAYALLWFAGLASLASWPVRPRPALFASTMLGLAALTRPEGVAFWILGLLVPALSGKPERKRTIGAYLLPGLGLLLFVVWRLAYYGVPFPNTYYAKTGGGVAMWEQGLHGLRLFLSSPAHGFWVATAILGAVVGIRRGRPRVAVVCATAVTLHLLYVVSVGDDGLRVHRFYAPILAPLALASGLLFLPAPPRARRRASEIVGAAMMVVTIGASLWSYHFRVVPSMRRALAYQEGNVKLGHYLRAHHPDEWIAVAAAGAIPYYSGAPAIDMYGLNDPHIARLPFPEPNRGRMMKWDNAYVLSRRPQRIAINRGYFETGDPNRLRVERDPGMLAVSAMDRDLFDRVSRDGGYRLRAIEFDDGSSFVVFERRPTGGDP